MSTQTEFGFFATENARRAKFKNQEQLSIKGFDRVSSSYSCIMLGELISLLESYDGRPPLAEVMDLESNYCEGVPLTRMIEWSWHRSYAHTVVRVGLLQSPEFSRLAAVTILRAAAGCFSKDDQDEKKMWKRWLQRFESGWTPKNNVGCKSDFRVEYLCRELSYRIREGREHSVNALDHLCAWYEAKRSRKLSMHFHYGAGASDDLDTIVLHDCGLLTDRLRELTPVPTYESLSAAIAARKNQ